MNSIQIPGNPMQLELLLSKEEIAEKTNTIASLLDREYENKEIIIVMILKGSIFFVSDLMRSLHMPVRLETIHCTSYGDHGMKRGELKITGLDSLDLEGQHVLLVDDILDSGITISQVIEGIQKRHPKSLRSLVLLTKKVARQTDFEPDHFLFEIEDRFVVGYGLDYKEYYRNLPAIYAMTENT